MVPASTTAIAATAPPPSMSALTTPGLMQCLASFQDGLYEDLLPAHADWKRELDSASGKHVSFAQLLLTSLADTRYVLHAAIARADVAVMARLLRCRPHLLTSDAMDCAASFGHLDLVRYFHNGAHPCTARAMDLAATHGHAHVVEFLHRHRREGCTERAMQGAAEAGHLSIVQFLHAHRHESTTNRAMDYAARNGHFDVVRFLHFHRAEGCSSIAMDFAASHGHLEIVQFLHSYRTEGCSTYAMDGAARNGHIRVVRFLHEHRTEGCSKKALLHAIQHHQLEMVAILRSYHHQYNLFHSSSSMLARAKQQLFRRRTPTRPHRYFLHGR
ncbi:Aste57867_24331 [Aphanomyces stellatus]|uniref:Aste57867_24331 protein n=1 Tax=Aphanomyces stellatus TaxID=120398 RepID=A0A485LQW0_9STRA|nr:hypothetical protein As57867_024256 [Aphanomyces stellatus]VFU00971.1 Aste57867_24331 [Aphanomyces stellatus]